jgi:CubicO group peptidase (beta-lactamase class C family)
MVWDYGHSTDLLGRVIEVASGQSLFQAASGNPLGMTHTAFYVADGIKRGFIAQFMPTDAWKPICRDQRTDGARETAQERLSLLAYEEPLIEKIDLAERDASGVKPVEE